MPARPVRRSGARPHSPVEIVQLLAEVGAYGVNLHDNDLVPIDATPAERDQIVKRFQAGAWPTPASWCRWRRPICSPTPVFKDGAFTANDPKVRAYAMQKDHALRWIWASELGAERLCLLGRARRRETDASKEPRDASSGSARRSTSSANTSSDQRYNFKFALEPKPNEPRGDIYLPTVGAMLGFIATLDHPEMVGVNPEVAHEHMAGLNFVHAVAQAWTRASCSTST